MWIVNADTIAANSLKAEKFIDPFGNLLLSVQRWKIERRFTWTLAPINQLDSFSHRVLQSSRDFKASLTMSTKTGRTTHSILGLCCKALLIDGSNVLWALGWNELGVTIWTCFCFLVLIWMPLLDVSVCLLHKFKFWEFSMCFNKQSSCCWFDNEMNRFHCIMRKRENFS